MPAYKLSSVSTRQFEKGALLLGMSLMCHRLVELRSRMRIETESPPVEPAPENSVCRLPDRSSLAPTAKRTSKCFSYCLGLNGLECKRNRCALGLK